MKRELAFLTLKCFTAADKQTQVSIKVLWGQREMAADNKLLCEFKLMDAISERNVYII